VILVDTSVWINHFREYNSQLANLLEQGQVMCHPLIIGELACGHLHSRQKILNLLSALPRAEESTDILYFIEINKLMGRGIGIVDILLLASASSTEVSFWTMDKRLHDIAVELELAVNID
jgi:predicted nucleic acid-binding protein